MRRFECVLWFGLAATALGLMNVAALRSCLPPPAIFEFTASDFASNANEEVTISVKRSQGIACEAEVGYSVAAGTAEAGKHFTPTSGTLTFKPGELTQSFIVRPGGEDGSEKPRTVLLALSTPASGGKLGALAEATLTISWPAQLQPPAAQALLPPPPQPSLPQPPLPQPPQPLKGDVLVVVLDTGSRGSKLDTPAFEKQLDGVKVALRNHLLDRAIWRLDKQGLKKWVPGQKGNHQFSNENFDQLFAAAFLAADELARKVENPKFQLVLIWESDRNPDFDPQARSIKVPAERSVSLCYWFIDNNQKSERLAEWFGPAQALRPPTLERVQEYVEFLIPQR